MRKKCNAIGQESIVITEIAATWRKGAVTCQEEEKKDLAKFSAKSQNTSLKHKAKITLCIKKTYTMP